jgi:hypothetical protein
MPIVSRTDQGCLAVAYDPRGSGAGSSFSGSSASSNVSLSRWRCMTPEWICGSIVSVAHHPFPNCGWTDLTSIWFARHVVRTERTD